LTAWTALGLAGVIGFGPRIPVDLEVPFRPGRVGKRRRQRLQRQLSALGGKVVNLHPAVAGDSGAVEGMPVRTPAQAICAAVDTRAPLAMDLAAALLESGVLSRRDLLIASQVVGCERISELYFRQRAS
jgi:hypothetical protein